MFTLRTEIAACLIAVAVLGLLAGWMIQRARAARRIDELTAFWEGRHAELEESVRQDEANLEERLQSLAGEVRTLKAENRALRESARGREESRDNARAEAIEQNRRQAETQERLQRIIREREREIASLRARLDEREAGAPSVPIGRVREAERATEAFAGIDPLDETVRIDPAQLPDAHALEAANERLSASDLPASDVRALAGDAFDESLDSTIEVTMLEAEEETVVLDEEALALARGFGGGGNGGKS